MIRKLEFTKTKLAFEQTIMHVYSRYLLLSIITASILNAGCEESWEPYELDQVVIYASDPQGGMPGTVINVIGLGFDLVPEGNTVTINGLSTEVISASESNLIIRIPSTADFADAELIIASKGLKPDTSKLIITENPLAQVTDISPKTGSTRTIVTIYGNNFNPFEDAYFVYYEDPVDGLFVPRTDDGIYLSTLLFASKDSLKIQIPYGFQGGRVRLNTETVGQPLNSRYNLRTPEFILKP